MIRVFQTLFLFFTLFSIVGCIDNLFGTDSSSKIEVIASALPVDFTHNFAVINGSDSAILHNIENIDSYTVYKSTLPIITISTSKTIIDEEKVSANISIIDNGIITCQSPIGIEIRGGSSKSFPKKSYTFNLYEDESESKIHKRSLLGMRCDDDWILDGMWNEPNRIRDYTNHEIWKMIARVPKNYSDDDHDNKDDHSDNDSEDNDHNESNHDDGNMIPGINREYCELFINGSYFGIYYLGERIDKKQLNLKKSGELYKASDWGLGTCFSGIEPIDNTSNYWSGFEYKYPDAINWLNLYALIEFCTQTDEETFNNGVLDRIDLANVVDYFIMINFTFAPDNTGKNLYIARHDKHSKYYFVAWDMDATLGLGFDGKQGLDTNMILKNDLFYRLLQNNDFTEELQSRWDMLKRGPLSPLTVKEMFHNNYNALVQSGAFEREKIAISSLLQHGEEALITLDSYIDKRYNDMNCIVENP